MDARLTPAEARARLRAVAARADARRSKRATLAFYATAGLALGALPGLRRSLVRGTGRILASGLARRVRARDRR